LRLTTPRKLLFETLKKATAPLSQSELATANPTIDRVSVYRTIELFMRLGIVTSVPHGWKQRYELAAPFRPHHHHLFCTVCGEADEIQSEKLERIIHIIADEQKFSVIGHMFEVTGICSKCQQNRHLS
jgi:Fur family transcriptional regulator, ferric uptake regulator